MNIFKYLLKHPADWDRSSGYVGNSWWIAFHAKGERDFTGDIIHLHIATPSDWVPMINDVQSWAVAGAGIAGAAGIIAAPVAAIAIPVVALAWQVSSNKDGTYDFYAINESLVWFKRWHFKFYSTYINFIGFVSDVSHKPPLSINPGDLVNVGKFSAVKRVAAAYRHDPRPI